MKSEEALKLEGLMDIAGMYAAGIKYGHRILAYDVVCKRKKQAGTMHIDVKNLSCRFDLRDSYKRDKGVMLLVDGEIVSKAGLGTKVDGIWQPAKPIVTRLKEESLWVSYEHMGDIIKYIAEQGIKLKEAYTGKVTEAGIVERISNVFKRLVA